MSYCATHLTNYPLGATCPECHLEQIREAQEKLIEIEREARRDAKDQHDALINSIRESEYRSRNPGNYQCPACKLITLLDGASRCPMCRTDVPSSYWLSVRERAQRAREAEAAAKRSEEEAKVAEASRVPSLQSSTAIAAAAAVMVPLSECKERRAQGQEKPESEFCGWKLSSWSWDLGNQRWLIQPVLTLCGGKEFRFRTFDEYIAALFQLRAVFKDPLPLAEPISKLYDAQRNSQERLRATEEAAQARAAKELLKEQERLKDKAIVNRAFMAFFTVWFLGILIGASRGGPIGFVIGAVLGFFAGFVAMAAFLGKN
jgi:hypothetical protein